MPPQDLDAISLDMSHRCAPPIPEAILLQQAAEGPQQHLICLIPLDPFALNVRNSNEDSRSRGARSRVALPDQTLPRPFTWS